MAENVLAFSEQFGGLGTQLASIVGPSANEHEYFKVHLSRYLATLEFLPEASLNQSILEVGAAFNHLTLFLRTLKGYSSVRCTDVWDGEATVIRTFVEPTTLKRYEFAVDNCDAEQAPWPYRDGEFDVVLCAEILEHLVLDPMCMLAEVNRTLKPDGLLVLTTPNIASAKSLVAILAGESPYIYGKFEVGGRPTDRHNREYTPSEVRRLLEAAGFCVIRLQTKDSWWKGYEKILGSPAATASQHLGDNIFCLARKSTGVIDRYPQEFYLQIGIQRTRREFELDEVRHAKLT